MPSVKLGLFVKDDGCALFTGFPRLNGRSLARVFGERGRG